MTPAYPPSPGGTLIGESIRIKGEIHSREDLRLDGEIEGQLDVDGRLTIGPNGKANAEIAAKEVIMSGSVKGNIDAKQRLVLTKGANLVGDVKTAGIVIEDGAYFKGGIDIVRPNPEGSKEKPEGAKEKPPGSAEKPAGKSS
jgi:cytoskeletal protein CcmA (bactofilin family)